MVKFQIEPHEELLFQPTNDGSGASNLSATISLKNSDTMPILFRIQTTSPLVYRVKPSHGWVLPSSSVSVLVVHVGASTITTTSGDGGAAALSKVDKFLVKFGPIASPIDLPDPQSSQAAERFSTLVTRKHHFYFFCSGQV